MSAPDSPLEAEKVEKAQQPSLASADGVVVESAQVVVDETPAAQEQAPGSSSTTGNPLERAVTEEWDEYISGYQLVVVMACVCIVGFIMLLDTSIIATAIPRITDEFHSLPDIGWYASAYQLASASFQPMTGKIFSHFSSKWSFMSFLAVFELGSLLCGLASSSKMLIVGRAVAGMGSAGVFNGALTIIAGSVPIEKRATLTGIVMGVTQLGIVCGPIIGGVLTEYATWRWCFYINLPIGGAAAIFLAFNRIPDQIKKPDLRTALRKVSTEFDFIGFALFAPAAIQLLLALQYGGNDFPWNSPTVIGLFCGFGGTSIVWGIWNYYRGEHALIPVSLITQRVVWSSALTQMFLLSSMLVTSYFLPTYFQAVRNATPAMSGVYTLATIMSQLISAVSSGILAGRLFGFVIPWTIASGIVAAIGSGLYGLFTPYTSTGMWVGFQIINGLGRGMGIQMPILAVQVALKPSQIAMAMSLLSFVQYMGTAIFLVISTVIFRETLMKQIPEYAPGVNPELVIAAGATNFRQFVKSEDLPGVLVAYAKSVDNTFYVGATLAAATLVTCWGMGWNDIRKKKEPAKGEA